MPTKDEIFAKIRTALVDALGVDEEEVTPDATLVGDLGASRLTFWISSSGWKRPLISRCHAASCFLRIS